MEARRIQAIRETLGLTQAELAKAIGVTRVSVAMWELGHTTANPKHSKDLADFARKSGLDPDNIPSYCKACAKTGIPGGLCKRHASVGAA